MLATGSRVPRDLPVPGRELDGVHFALEYLYGRNRAVADTAEPELTAAGKHVIVVGGGDTGADCVASAHREGAASVTQIELLGEPPARRPDDLTPWPLWPAKLRTSYALKEGGERSFAISTTGLSGDGRVERIHWVRNDGAPPFAPIAGSEETPPGRPRPARDGLPRPGAAAARRARRRARRARQRRDRELRDVVPRRLRRGGRAPRPVAVVWAIEEGRRCAAAVDAALAEPPAPDRAGRAGRAARG